MSAVKLDSRVTEMLCSRICHDLVSLVGAINNGVELLEEFDGPMAEEALTLVAQSGQRAAARLKFFRLAYGAAGGQSLGVEEARETAHALLEGTKVALDWPPGAQAVMPSQRPGAVKMLLNLILLADEALHHGGTITVSVTEGGVDAQQALITAQGPSVGLADEARAALSGTLAMDHINPRAVHPFITSQFARIYGLRIDSRAVGDDTLTFSLSLG